MPKFTAGNAVSSLEWDFTRYQPQTDPPSPAWAGVIPEPSVDDIEAFEKAVRAVAPTGDPTKLGAIDTDAVAGVFDTLRSALATLCKGSPTLAQIEALPFRVLVAFIGYVSGNLSNPQ